MISNGPAHISSLVMLLGIQAVPFVGNPELYDPTDTCRPTVG